MNSFKDSLLLACFGLFMITAPQTLRASHAAGGEIYYEYIGDSTGVNHQYLITLTLYRRTAGIQFNSTESINISSSCYSNQNITVNAISQNTPLLYFTECTDSNITNSLVNYYRYRGTVTLPGVCSDYRFSYDICCRNNDIDNLATYPAIYLESYLNNTLGPNNSPKIQSEGSKAFCIGTNVNWSQSAIDEDGDSLFYELIQPLSAYNQPIAFAPGYSVSQPITTINGVSLNSRTGDFEFTPSQTEVLAVRFRVSEFAIDTLWGWFKVGHVDRDVQIYILNSCPANPTNISYSAADSLSADTASLACGMKRLHLNFSGRIDCRSIAPDGSDFAMFNSYGSLIPIIAAGSDSCSSNISQSIWIEFYDSIYYNDDVHLVVRTGTDFNTIESVCGAALADGDSIPLKITGCSSSIGVFESDLKDWILFPNPADEILNVNTPNESTVSYDIINMNGAIILSGQLQEISNMIDIAPLPQGVYLLRLSSASTTEIRKFIKQ